MLPLHKFQYNANSFQVAGVNQLHKVRHESLEIVLARTWKYERQKNSLITNCSCSPVKQARSRWSYRTSCYAKSQFKPSYQVKSKADWVGLTRNVAAPPTTDWNEHASMRRELSLSNAENASLHHFHLSQLSKRFQPFQQTFKQFHK